MEIRKHFNWSTKNYLNWFFLALAIRTVIFIFFNFEFQQNWPDELRDSVAIFHNDSYGYYNPLESIYSGEGYVTACRMPGLVPVYCASRVFFSHPNAIIFIVLLQVIIGAISVVALAAAAYKLIASELAFKIVFFTYAISSFVTIWDHAAQSDSFSVSFMVFALYFLVKLKQKLHWKNALLFGLFFAWSVFHRPAHIVAFPLLFFFIFSIKGITLCAFRMAIYYSIIGILPFLIFDAIWVGYNFQKMKRVVFLQDEDRVCFQALADHHVATRNFVIGRGGDFKEWSLNTELAWIMDGDTASKFSFNESYFTPKYGMDSLNTLKRYYTQSKDSAATEIERQAAISRVENLALNMNNDYKMERKLDYYFLNRIKLILLFAFSGTVENLPLPAKADMNVFEFGIKAFYVLLLHAVVLLFFFGFCYAIYSKDLGILAISSFPIILILIIGAFLGYAEQRYLTPVYPFMLVVAAYFVNLFSKKRSVI